MTRSRRALLLRCSQSSSSFLGRVCSTKSLMFHPRFHRDVNNPETFRSVTLEHAAPKRAPKSTTKSRGHFPTFTPLVSRRAPHEVSMAEGSEPLSSTKRKSSDPLPAGKKPRKTVASGTVRLAKDLRTTIGKEPGSSQGAIAAPLYVDHDFSLLPSSLHDVEDVALEGIDLEAPLPILSQSAKSSIKTSEGVQGGPRGSLSDPKNTHTFPPQSMHEPNKEASPNHKTPRKESWKPVIDQLMWDPILTGGSSAFTPVALPDSPRELIAVFTPPPKRVLFDTNQQPPQSPMKGMIPCRGKDLSCDDLDVLDDMSVTKVVAV